MTGKASTREATITSPMTPRISSIAVILLVCYYNFFNHALVDSSLKPLLAEPLVDFLTVESSSFFKAFYLLVGFRRNVVRFALAEV